MRHMMLILLLVLVGALLTGCGSAPRPIEQQRPVPVTVPLPPAETVFSSWEFHADSHSNPGTTLKLSGSLERSGQTVSLVLQVQDSACFQPQSALRLSGTVSGTNASLVSSSIDGQVVSFSGALNQGTTDLGSFIGTYRVEGGCANGENGSLTGAQVVDINGFWSGEFVPDDVSQGKMQVAVEIEAETTNSDGSFSLSGTMTTDTCGFGKIKPAHSIGDGGSYSLGRSVFVVTDDGKVGMRTSIAQDGTMTLNSTFGSCGTITGTGKLTNSPWAY